MLQGKNGLIEVEQRLQNVFCKNTSRDFSLEVY